MQVSGCVIGKVFCRSQTWTRILGRRFSERWISERNFFHTAIQATDIPATGGHRRGRNVSRGNRDSRPGPIDPWKLAHEIRRCSAYSPLRAAYCITLRSGKHKGKRIDFKVVVKDGKVGIKPVVKK